MNLFKSLGVACAVVAVNSCDTNKGNNDNKSDDVKKKEEVRKLLGEKGYQPKSDEALDEVIYSENGRKLDAKEIADKMVEDGKVVEESKGRAPIVRQQGSTESSVEKIEKCETFKDLFYLVKNKVVDLKEDENKKAFFEKVEGSVEDKEYILSRNCKILDFEIKDNISLCDVLEGINLVKSSGKYNNIKIVVEDDSCIDLLYGGSKCSYNDYKNYSIEYRDRSSKGKIVIKKGSKDFNVKIGSSEVVVGIDELYKLIFVLYSLGSVSGRDNFFDKQIGEVKYDNANKGEFTIFGQKGGTLGTDDLMGVYKNIKECRECGMFDSVLKGVIVSSDAMGTSLKNDDTGSYIMGVEIKNLKIKEKLKTDRELEDVAVDIFNTLLGREDAKWDKNSSTVIVNCPKNNKIVLE